MKKIILLTAVFTLMAFAIYGLHIGGFYGVLKGAGSDGGVPVLTIVPPEPPAELNIVPPEPPTAYLNIVGPNKPKPLDGQGLYFNIVGPSPPRPMSYPNPTLEDMGFWIEELLKKQLFFYLF